MSALKSILPQLSAIKATAPIYGRGCCDGCSWAKDEGHVLLAALEEARELLTQAEKALTGVVADEPRAINNASVTMHRLREALGMYAIREALGQ